MSRGMRKTRSGAFGMAVLWSAVSGAVLATASPAWCQTSDAPASIKEDLRAAKSLSRAFQYAAGKIAPSVVHISSRSVLRGRDFFGMPLSRNVEGVGSGIVVTRDGYIITNNHVVENAEQIEVQFLDGRKLAGKVVGTDPATDLAVVKVDASDLTPAEFGDSDGIEVGEWVLAVGSPFGTFDHSVTAGIVSATNRTGLAGEGEKFEEFIQTDAAINPGNSGGPLVNLEGRVVGVNSQIASRSGGSVGIGFSIPSSITRSVLDMITKKGKVEHGWIGVDMADQRQGGSAAEPADGVLVRKVVEGGPAEKAGIRPGDLIVGFNGRRIAGSNRLKNAIAYTYPGSDAEIEIQRDGRPMSIRTEVGELRAGKRMASGAVTLPKLGLSVAPLDPSVPRMLREADLTGVTVVDVDDDGPAGAGGIEPGDIIVGINNTEVEGMEQFNRLAGGVDLKRRTRVWVIRVQPGFPAQKGYLDIGGKR